MNRIQNRWGRCSNQQTEHLLFWHYSYFYCLKYVCFILLPALHFLPLTVLHKSVSCGHWIKNQNSWAAKVQRSMVGREEREQRASKMGKNHYWLNEPPEMACLCLLSASVHFCPLSSSQPTRQSSQSVHQSDCQPRPCCPSLSFSLRLSLRAPFAGSCLLHKAISFSRLH